MNKRLFLLLSLISFPILLFGQRPILKVERLTTHNGLSLNTITCTLKDSKGYLWFGTKDGLNKYNGYEFTVFKNIKDDSTSLPFNDILTIAEDQQGRIWVGTNGGGLSRFDRKTNTFRTYRESATNFESISNNSITHLFVDKAGNLWIGTYWGLNLYNEKKDNFTRFYTYDEQFSLSSNSIAKIAEDNSGNLWIGTIGDGLNLFDRKTFSSKRFAADGKQGSLSNNNINNLLVDRKSRLWVATRRGLNLYHPESGTFSSYYSSPLDPYALSGDNIVSIDDDQHGNLWLGTDFQGLNYLETESGKVYSFWADPKDHQQLSSNSASSIYIDNENIVWIGTNSGGINKYDPNLPAFTHLNTNPNTTTINGFAEDTEGNFWIATDGSGIDHYNVTTGEVFNISSNNKPDGLSSNGIVCLYTDRSGNLWVGTFGGGLNYYNVKENKFYHYYQGDKHDDLSNNNIYSILEDSKGKVWIGTLGGGVNVLDKETRKISRYSFKNGDESTLSGDYISSIAEDSKGQIWIGTFGAGINLFIPSTNSFRSYRDNYSNVSNNIISTIFPDLQGNLWIGTGGNGLLYFDYENNKLVSYQSQNNLASSFIKAIKDDNQGNLWISTNNGLAKLNLTDKKYKNFDVYDGLQDSEFRERAALKLKSGKLLFGGINGFNLFDPEKIVDSKRLPHVVLSHFEIFNEAVKIGTKDSPLTSDISETEEITLSYRQSVFTIGFTGLHYTLPEKTKYAYMLVGFDKDWRHVDNERKATYTNLDPGVYYFKVKAANKDNIWNNQPTILKITILPPWWLTWWFYLLLALSVCSIFVLIFQLRTKVLRKQQKVLKVEVAKRTIELNKSNAELTKQAKHMEDLYVENKAQAERLKSLYHEITDSIKAAREIQQSILPSPHFISKYLAEYFIFYHPKDVVSGDFYWINAKDNKIVIAAVDCTGHGVSGAFMSINGHHLLNQAIYPYDNLVASEVLDRLNTSMKKELLQQDGDLMTENGFDIGLCILDLEKKTLEFSGAKHPLYILREQNIIELKGDKYSIGAGVFYMRKKSQKFTNYVVELKKDDVLYLFTDGYPDQIGGPKGSEKFLHIRLKEILVKLGEMDMDTQRQVLENEFFKWKGEHEQLDDVLVFGVRI